MCKKCNDLHAISQNCSAHIWKQLLGALRAHRACTWLLAYTKARWSHWDRSMDSSFLFFIVHKNKALHFQHHSYTHQQYSKYRTVQLRGIHIIYLLLQMATAIASLAASHCHSKLTAEFTSSLHLKLSHLGSLHA